MHWLASTCVQRLREMSPGGSSAWTCAWQRVPVRSASYPVSGGKERDILSRVKKFLS